jgi:hypothetical protein
MLRPLVTPSGQFAPPAALQGSGRGIYGLCNCLKIGGYETGIPDRCRRLRKMVWPSQPGAVARGR